MEEIIKKAIEGKYTYMGSANYKYKAERIAFYDKSGKYIFWTSESKIILDPKFWSALSSKCDWKNPNNDGSLFVALRFYEINLTENWDAAVAYLTNLIKG